MATAIQQRNINEANPSSAHPRDLQLTPPRIAARGTVLWTCPACQTATQSSITPQTWQLTCAYRQCKRQWAFGHRLGILSAGFQRTPADLTLPVGTLYNHKCGDPVNELVADSGSDVTKE